MDIQLDPETHNLMIYCPVDGTQVKYHGDSIDEIPICGNGHLWKIEVSLQRIEPDIHKFFQQRQYQRGLRVEFNEVELSRT